MLEDGQCCLLVIVDIYIWCQYNEEHDVSMQLTSPCKDVKLTWDTVTHTLVSVGDRSFLNISPSPDESYAFNLVTSAYPPLTFIM